MTLRERLLEELPDATRIVRAPGRVNLIGEHTDYSWFPVLPMAIENSVWIAAVSRNDGLLHMRNLESARYPEEVLCVPDIADRPRRGFWSDYVAAAAREVDVGFGAELVVGSDLPAAAGLSSSAALIVGSLLAFDAALDADREELARLAVRAENSLGTMVGGMDQTVCALAQEGHALRIDFRPELRTTPVPIPDDLRIVVVDSGVRAEKGAALQDEYNARVIACAEAAKLLGASEPALLSGVPEGRRADVSQLESELLRKRAGFVFAEARRVDAAVAALEKNDLVAFGELLDMSHRGLRDEFEVSHPEVDELVELARTSGALGARIVGAGFGGCLIAATTAADVDRVVAAFGGAAQVVTPSAGASREDLA